MLVNYSQRTLFFYSMAPAAAPNNHYRPASLRVCSFASTFVILVSEGAKVTASATICCWDSFYWSVNSPIGRPSWTDCQCKYRIHREVTAKLLPCDYNVITLVAAGSTCGLSDCIYPLPTVTFQRNSFCFSPHWKFQISKLNWTEFLCVFMLSVNLLTVVVKQTFYTIKLPWEFEYFNWKPDFNVCRLLTTTYYNRAARLQCSAFGIKPLYLLLG